MIKESGEMYLESILILNHDLEKVRAIDLAEFMNYSKPSVSRALKILLSEKYITIDENGFISLTKAGFNIAQNIYEKHQVLTKLLQNLGVDEKTATDDACKIEHVLSDKSFMAIKKYFSK